MGSRLLLYFYCTSTVGTVWVEFLCMVDVVHKEERAVAYGEKAADKNNLTARS
jgi:hypothetical protein